MTLRSIIIGLLFGSLIAAFGYYNDHYLRLTFLVGNHFPITVFGAVVLIMVAINPLLRRIGRNLPLRSSELAVTIIIVLAACSVPSSGLMRLFTSSLVMPTYRAQNKPGWQRHNVLSYVPSHLMANDGKLDDTVVAGYVKGLDLRADSGETATVGLGDIPWYGWAKPLACWVPLILLCFAGVIGLSLVVHRQWSRHERLRYPIATVATLLIERDKDHAFGRIYRNRLFWLGAAVVMAIHLINGLNAWDVWQFKIDMTFPLSNTVFNKYPEMNVPGAWGAFIWRLYPTAIALAYFLASDVAFSLGISRYVYLAASLMLVEAGVEMTGGGLVSGPTSWFIYGAYVGMAVMVLHTGRRYYLAVLQAAVGGKKDASLSIAGIWGARVFIAAGIAMTILLSTVFEMHPALAVLLILTIFLRFLVLARIIAETGLFFVQPGWLPLAVFAGIFGFQSLGPTQFLLLGLVSIVLAGDPRETLMPFVVNGLKLGEETGIRRGRAGGLTALAVVVALAVAIPAVLLTQYNLGMNNDSWANDSATMTSFSQLTQAMTLANAQDQLSDVLQHNAAGELGPLNVDPDFVWFGSAGLLLVLGCSFMRLRFTWWPIHPVLFLVAITYPLYMMHFSFLLGWLIKSAVTRVGGVKTYRAGRPLMLGIIAGDLLGGLTFNIAAMIVAAGGGNIHRYAIFPM